MSNDPSDQPIRVFVSSPGNLRPERMLVAKVCRRLSESMGVHVEPLLWEGGGQEEPDVSSFPPYFSGEGAQHEIDKRLQSKLCLAHDSPNRGPASRRGTQEILHPCSLVDLLRLANELPKVSRKRHGQAVGLA